MIGSLLLASMALLAAAVPRPQRPTQALPLDWKDERYLAPPPVGNSSSVLPILVWHGLGDFCLNPLSMVPFVEFVGNITGAQVHCLQIGADFAWDSQNSW